MSIEKEVSQIVTEQMGISDTAELDRTISLRNLKANVLDMIRIVSRVKRRYGIKFPSDYDIANRSTLDIADYVAEQKLYFLHGHGD